MLTIIVAGRNDDYGKNFRARLFRSVLHNCRLLDEAGIHFEYILSEWNPLADRPPLSEEFVTKVPNARALIIPSGIHQKYSLNPRMPFHEMPAKNAAIRRALGDVVIVTNADILFSETLVERIGRGDFADDTLYRAHRIDVQSELSWHEIQDPANQLASGEGVLPPPYYLGAGGDFCLAARSLWHELRGFNEQIRFSTRAKDWQFFLSAAAQGVKVEFIGDIYHLDHEQGFRNTNAADRSSDRAHFGKWWDIEFGLPVTNSDLWGLSGMREYESQSDSRIVALEPQDYRIAQERNALDRDVMTWLTRSDDSNEMAAAFLLHTILAAHRERRRLIFRLKDVQLAATLSGFDAVASHFGVRICSNWKWPEVAGFNIHKFASEPQALEHRDWVVEETAHGMWFYESGTGQGTYVLPGKIRVSEPEFNPVLARRLLRAYLDIQEKGHCRFAICGAGSHTKELLRWGIPDTLELAGIVDSFSQEFVDADCPVLLSSASFESDMAAACAQHGIQNIIALYNDWPRNVWASEPVTVR
jgi:hypothetical protein